MITTPNLSLIAWNLPSDPYSSDELAENWIKVDQHDHTPGKGARIDTAAISDQAITPAKLHPDSLPDLTIPDNSITAAKIVDGEVGSAEIATDAVTAAEILAGAVGNAELAANAVTRSKAAKSFVQGGRLSFAAETAKTLTWSSSFGDTSYSVVFSIQMSPPAYNPIAITAKTATTVTITAGYAFTGTVHLIGIHD